MGVFRLEGNKVNALPVASGRVFHPGDHAGRLLVPRVHASGLVLKMPHSCDYSLSKSVTVISQGVQRSFSRSVRACTASRSITFDDRATD